MFSSHSHRSWLVVTIACSSLAVVSGCSTNKEEQRFYESGWLWPRSLDTPDRPVTPRERRDAAAEAAHPSRDW